MSFNAALLGLMFEWQEIDIAFPTSMSLSAVTIYYNSYKSSNESKLGQLMASFISIQTSLGFQFDNFVNISSVITSRPNYIMNKHFQSKILNASTSSIVDVESCPMQRIPIKISSQFLYSASQLQKLLIFERVQIDRAADGGYMLAIPSMSNLFDVLSSLNSSNRSIRVSLSSLHSTCLPQLLSFCLARYLRVQKAYKFHCANISFKLNVTRLQQDEFSLRREQCCIEFLLSFILSFYDGHSNT